MKSYLRKLGALAVNFLASPSCHRKVVLLGIVNLLIAANAQAGIAPPTNLSASTISSNKVVLSWTDNSSNEKNEVVSRSLQATSGFSAIATLPAGATTYTDTTVAPST